MQLSDALLIALLSAGMTWGAMRIEIRWLRRDVDLAHSRINDLPCRQYGRRQGDSCNHPKE